MKSQHQTDDVEETTIGVMSEDGNVLRDGAGTPGAQEALRGLAHALGHLLHDHPGLDDGPNDFRLSFEVEDGEIVAVGLFGAEDEDEEEGTALDALDADAADAVRQRATRYAKAVARDFDVDADALADDVAELTAEAVGGDDDAEDADGEDDD